MAAVLERFLFGRLIHPVERSNPVRQRTLRLLIISRAGLASGGNNRQRKFASASPSPIVDATTRLQRGLISLCRAERADEIKIFIYKIFDILLQHIDQCQRRYVFQSSIDSWLKPHCPFEEIGLTTLISRAPRD